jgi:translation initiation factor 4G
MNSTPNSKSNSDTNAKSTPQPVFNYAQAAKRNSQTLEQKTTPTTTGSDKPSNPTGSPGNKPSPSNPPLKQQQPSQKFTGNSTSTTLQKDNDNTDMSGSKPAAPSKPSVASTAHHT